MTTFEIVLLTIAGTTLAIIIAEIFFDYALGDKVKDFFVGLFRGAEAKAIAAKKRLQSRAARIKAAL